MSLRRACEPWLARAFGVELELTFDVPALRTAATDLAADPTTVEIADLAGRPAGEGRPLAWLPDGRGGAVVEVREYPEVGILVAARDLGSFLISSDARRVSCALPAGLHWQHLLVGQVLPLVATLRGLHVIHASAVALGDGAIALAGRSGAGKSTLAAEFARAGHPMVAEDVLALRLDEGAPVAEPGLSLPEFPRAPEALPLHALYLLDETDGGDPSPTDLMATTFVPYRAGGTGHLELAAALARSVTLARVRVDRTRPPGELAARIERHAASVARSAAFLPA